MDGPLPTTVGEPCITVDGVLYRESTIRSMLRRLVWFELATSNLKSGRLSTIRFLQNIEELDEE